MGILDLKRGTHVRRVFVANILYMIYYNVNAYLTLAASIHAFENAISLQA